MTDHSLSTFNCLSTDLIELILSYLPLPSLIRSSCVCKLWNSIIDSPCFPSRPPSSSPWFFLYGLHNTSSRNNQSFAYDPISNSWYKLPIHQDNSFIASSGFLFTTNSSFTYTSIFNHSWRVTSPLRFPRINPLLAVFPQQTGLGFIIVGGVRFIGNLVDIEDRLDVEIYNPKIDCWELCPPLPADFRSGNSSHALSSALFRGKLYVFGISSCFLSCFDLKSRVWSDVMTLRPPGVMFSFLIACRDRLALAGMCNGINGPTFCVWEIDVGTMEFSEFAIMPSELLNGLVDSEDDDKFASLKCVGSGNLIYVFNEEYHKKYPACVCEMIDSSREYGKCRWKRLPDLPSPVNKFHKVISFCSMVSIHSILHGEGGR